MIPLALLAFLTGAVLGIRWRVLVLLPSCFLFAAAMAVVVSVEKAGIMTAALGIAAVLTAVQLGYLFGLMTRGYLAYGPERKSNIVARRSALKRV